MNYPLAEQHPQETTGGTMTGGTRRAVLHTTETAWWAGADWYHIEYRDGVWRQYRPFEKAARGLLHPAGTPQTNREGEVCIQVAVTGYAKDSADWPTETYRALAAFAQWCHDQYDIPLVSRLVTGGGSECYGADSPCRMGWDEWANLTGWCAHQEVPINAHWDAGKVDWSRIIGGTMPEPTEPEYRGVANVEQWEEAAYDWAIDEAGMVKTGDEHPDDARANLDDGRFYTLLKRYHDTLVKPVHEALWAGQANLDLAVSSLTSAVDSLADAIAAHTKRIEALEATTPPSNGLSYGDTVKLEAPDA